MENIANRVSELLENLSFIPDTAWRLAFAGAVLIIVLFLLALLFTVGSKIKSLTKKLIVVNQAIANEARIDEDNVELLNGLLKNLPEEVQDGWSRFMEQRTGYPSDYMKEKNVLDDTVYQPKNKAGELFFRIFGFLVVALAAFFAVICLVGDVKNIGLADFVDNFKVVGGVVGTVVFPILLYIIFDVILNAVYRKQRKRLQLIFKSFQDNLDQKVVIYASDEEEFTSENLEEITHNIEEIIASRLGNKEIIEVITAPKIDETEFIEQLAPAEFTPIELPKQTEKAVVSAEKAIVKEEKEEVEEIIPLTKEEQSSRLAILYDIVDAAIADNNTTINDLEQIAELIYNNLNNFEDKNDRDVLEGCLYKLSDLDTVIANRNK